MPIKMNKAVRKELKKLGEVKVEVEGKPDEDGNISDIVLIDPGKYRLGSLEKRCLSSSC